MINVGHCPYQASLVMSPSRTGFRSSNTISINMSQLLRDIAGHEVHTMLVPAVSYVLKGVTHGCKEIRSLYGQMTLSIVFLESFLQLAVDTPQTLKHYLQLLGKVYTRLSVVRYSNLAGHNMAHGKQSISVPRI